MPALRIKHPNVGFITHVLRSECVTVGRAADNSIQIPHDSISNYHAEIVLTEGRYRLRDLRSTNHSYVDGEKIAEHDLAEGCKILFGSIECEYDPHATTTARPPEPQPLAAPSAQIAILENENRQLRLNITSMQRRFDILGSARLTAGRTDGTPFAAATVAMRGLTAERDDLRQQAAGLRLEIGRLREDLAVTLRERDAARDAASAMQGERTSLQLELQKAELRIERLRSELIIANEAAEAPRLAPPPARPPVVTPLAPPPRPASLLPRLPAPSIAVADLTPQPLISPPARVQSPEPPPRVVCTTRTAPAPRPATNDHTYQRDRLSIHIGTLRERITQLAAAPADATLLLGAHAEVVQVLDHAAPLGAHPLRRIATRMEALLADLTGHERPPATGTLRTLRHSAELLERLLDPSLAEAAAELPTAQVLAIDDDHELLAALSDMLHSTGVEVSGCINAEEAMIAIEALHFDTIIADIGLPGINGTDFCAHARSRPVYRRTPILFLTGADTLDQRAETSLNGGTEFIAKPFDTAELSLKIEAWTLKHQLQLT